jgi:2-desacetyl-2-hydroxyethyl bacteriochlorophyllide A dehydrogenase
MENPSILLTGKQTIEFRHDQLKDLPDDGILVEARRSVISTGTEMTVFNRNYADGTHWDQWVQYPFHMGYLMAGVVVKVGKDVTRFKPGDRITTRRWHAKYNIANEGLSAHIPDNVSDEEAAWMGLGKIVQIGVRAAEHKMGDVVVLVGMGLLGQLAAQYVRLLGASEVIVIDTAPKRLEMAAAHGATVTLQMTAEQAKPEVERLTGKHGADVVYDITGHASVLPAALGMARKFGTVVLLGDAGSPAQQHLAGDLITKGLKLVGAHDGLPVERRNAHVRWGAVEMFELFLQYLSRGQMRVKDLITHRYQPAQAAEAYAMLNRERETAMGVVFEW